MSTETPSSGSQPSPAPAPASGENNVVAILSYLTIVGLIVALVMHNSNKTALGAYHLRQALGFFVFCIVFGIAVGILGLIPFVNVVVGLLLIPVAIGLFVLWVLALISAIKGEQKPMPLLGASFQSWFANAFV